MQGFYVSLCHMIRVSKRVNHWLRDLGFKTSIKDLFGFIWRNGNPHVVEHNSALTQWDRTLTPSRWIKTQPCLVAARLKDGKICPKAHAQRYAPSHALSGCTGCDSFLMVAKIKIPIYNFFAVSYLMIFIPNIKNSATNGREFSRVGCRMAATCIWGQNPLYYMSFISQSLVGMVCFSWWNIVGWRISHD